jgi:licheninase
MDSAEGWDRHFERVAQSGAETGNDELEDYVLEQVQLRGSEIALVLQRRGERYVSGKIRSRRSLKDMAPHGGVLEISLRGPKLEGGRVVGIWPAVWLLPSGEPWPMGGEIDLYEVMAYTPEGVKTGFSTLHFGPRPGQDASWPGHWGLSLGSYPWDAAGEHTLRLEWKRENGSWALNYAVDGREIWRFTTTRNDVFKSFEVGKPHSADFAPGAAGDPAAIFSRIFDKDLRIICNLAFGGRPFRYIDNVSSAEMVIMRARVVPH